jgi:uncharacterized protein YfaP (DUF2135 family)
MLRRFFQVGLLLILLVAVPVQAQEQPRILTPGISIDGALTADGLAQVFTYEGAAGEVVKLTLISGDGLALGVLVTDSDGVPVAQGKDEQGNGFLVVDNIALGADGIYYVTVLPLAVVDLPTEGEFSISLALAGDAAAPDSPTLTAAAPTPTPVAEDDTATVAEDAVLSGLVQTTSGIQVSLTWNATADFNLEVRDPAGGSLYWDSPTTESGGTFDTANVNGNCETFTADSPTETVSWSAGSVPAGSYEILVFYTQDCEANGAVSFTLDGAVDGQDFGRNGTILPNQVYLTSFVVESDGTVTLREGGVDQGALPAPSAELVAAAAAIADDTPTTDEITSESPYQAYTFDAAAGDVMTASMEATSGSLDAYLFLLDVNGNIVGENDDADIGTTDAAITNLPLNTPGTYTLIATRYGQIIGGTEGEYTLTLTRNQGGAGSEDNTLLGQTVPDGIIEVSLVWNSNADLQLLVRDPAGDAVFDDSPTIPSGGQLVLNGNVDCSVGTPVSYTLWPAGQRVRPGTYEIDVWFQNSCQDNTPVAATLNVSISGEVIISDEFSPLQGDNYITTFTINTDGSIVRGPGGIAGGSETIDYTAGLAAAPGLTSNIPVTGTISDSNRFDVYTFEGTANDVVSVRMEATAGTLDPLLFLLGPTGIELASNDDIVSGEDRNSLIADVTLPQSGQYIVLATHYGTIYGGTNGIYTLTLTR